MRSPSPGLYGSSPQGASPQPSGASTPLLSRAPTPPLLLPSRLLDTRKRYRLDLERLNFRRRSVYLTDLYHTLVNCHWYRFYALFIVFYLAMYAGFATFYASQPGCISKTHNFWHALWFSVTSSATIGYGHQAPDPNCYLLNVGVMAQVLVSLLMQASLLGVVFARISNSRGRSATIRFSKALSMYRKEDGLYRLAFRVANLRRSQVLSPKVRFLLLQRQAVHPFSSCEAEYVYAELPAAHIGGGHLWLGVPSVIEHKVDQRSPLWGMGEAEISNADMEFIVLLDGVDESTSRALEARHSYVPSDIRWQHQFEPCIQRRRSGKLGVDFARFDSTQLCSVGSAGNLGSTSTSGVFSTNAGQAQQQQQQPHADLLQDFSVYRLAGSGAGTAEAGQHGTTHADPAGAQPIPSPFSALLNGHT
ncbi:hypothetical protein ABPG77_010071 [Micractinium sp. CCAP 211/92]